MTREASLRLRLYVAGEGPNSLRARVNLQALCERPMAGHHDLELVDVLREPERALADGVFLTPMLVKLAPGPVCRIAGNLSDRATVLAALGLADGPEAR